jgi:hypothetical protein
VKVPGYFPDNDTVRGDLADYAIEVEWADSHIGKALDMLEKQGVARRHADHRHLRPRHAVSAREGPDLRRRLSSAAGDALGERHQARPCR